MKLLDCVVTTNFIRPIAVTLPTTLEPEFIIMMDAAKEIGVIA